MTPPKTTEHEDRIELSEAMLDSAEDRLETPGIIIRRWGRYIVFQVDDAGDAHEVFGALGTMVGMIEAMGTGEGGSNGGT